MKAIVTALERIANVLERIAVCLEAQDERASRPVSMADHRAGWQGGHR